MPLLLRCDTGDRFFWDRLGTWGRFHFHEETIHGNDGPPGLIFTLLFCNVVVSTAPPSCSVRTSLGTACVLLHALLSPTAMACSWVLLSLANLALRTLLLPFCLLLHLMCHYVLFESSSILSLHTILILSFPLLQVCTMLPALQARRKRLGHSVSLPAENRTRLIKANPHVHRVHTFVHVQLDHRPISCVSNVWILPAQQCSQLGRLFPLK